MGLLTLSFPLAPKPSAARRARDPARGRAGRATAADTRQIRGRRRPARRRRRRYATATVVPEVPDMIDRLGASPVPPAGGTASGAEPRCQKPERSAAPVTCCQTGRQTGGGAGLRRAVPTTAPHARSLCDPCTMLCALRWRCESAISLQYCGMFRSASHVLSDGASDGRRCWTPTCPSDDRASCALAV